MRCPCVVTAIYAVATVNRVSYQSDALMARHFSGRPALLLTMRRGRQSGLPGNKKKRKKEMKAKTHKTFRLLLQLLLGAKVGGVTALLLAAVDRADVKARVAPD